MNFTKALILLSLDFNIYERWLCVQISKCFGIFRNLTRTLRVILRATVEFEDLSYNVVLRCYHLQRRKMKCTFVNGQLTEFSTFANFYLEICVCCYFVVFGVWWWAVMMCESLSSTSWDSCQMFNCFNAAVTNSRRLWQKPFYFGLFTFLKNCCKGGCYKLVWICFAVKHQKLLEKLKAQLSKLFSVEFN